MSIKNSAIFTHKSLRTFCTYRLFFGMSYSLLIPIIPLYFESLGMTTVMIGLFLSLFGVSKTVTQLVFGVVTESVGDKLMIFVALVLMTFVPVAYTVNKAMNIAGVIYIVQGGILGMAAPATYALLARSLDKSRRGESTGLAAAVFTFGGAIGAAIGGYLVSQFNNYTLVFYLTSLGIGFTAVYLMFFIQKNQLKQRKHDPIQKRKLPLSQTMSEIKKHKLGSKVIVLSSIAFLGDFIYSCVVAMFHFYGEDVLGASTGYTSAIISIYLLVFGIGAPIAGFISDKIGNDKQIKLSFVMMNVSLLGLSLIKGIPLFTVIIIIYFLGATFMNASLQSSLSEFGMNDQIKGFVFGVVGGAESLGYAVGPIVAAYVYELQNTWFFVLLLAVSIIVTSIYICLRNRANLENKKI